MLILGITNNDNAGACLIENNEILSAVHEERFTRIKAHKVWPDKSINYVLSVNNKLLQDVDFIAYSWNAGFNTDYCLNLYVDRIIYECTHNKQNLNLFKKRISDEIINDKEKRKEFDLFISSNGLKNKVIYIDHHDSHAYGAWLCSPYDKALVVTCDGRGDFLSFTVRYIENNSEVILHRETSIDSLGYFYGRITKLLGFTPNKHEGKVTGLAAYGDPNNAKRLMEKMISINNSRIIAHCGEYYAPSYENYSDKLIEEINQFSQEDIAAAAQNHIEEIISTIISPHIRSYNVKNICLAGGLFANVKLNQKIRELPGVDNVFILPCMGDDGLPLAAAVTAMWKEYNIRCSFDNMCLGPHYTNEDIESILAQYENIKVDTPDNIQDSIIDLLKQNQVIAFVREKMEFGPRALCHRSIIYHANDRNMNIWLNKKLNRTEFMPFAPVTSNNLADICFENWQNDDKSSEFMTITYQCKSIMAEKCSAVVHVDNTARPQVIKKEKDPFMYSLINRWYQLTGQPCLVNTSFNRHEEPIINSPQEAMTVLLEGTIQAIIFNDKFIVTRKDKDDEL